MHTGHWAVLLTVNVRATFECSKMAQTENAKMCDLGYEIGYDNLACIWGD